MAAILVGARGDVRAHLDDLWQRMAMRTNPFVPGLFANTFPTPGIGGLYRLNPMYYAAAPLATYMYEPAPLAKGDRGVGRFPSCKALGDGTHRRRGRGEERTPGGILQPSAFRHKPCDGQREPAAHLPRGRHRRG